MLKENNFESYCRLKKGNADNRGWTQTTGWKVMRAPTNSMNALSRGTQQEVTAMLKKYFCFIIWGGALMSRAHLPKAMNLTTESIVLLSGLHQILVTPTQPAVPEWRYFSCAAHFSPRGL